MCRINRDYSHIKANIWRNDTGFLCCQLSSVSGQFILMMVSGDKDESICSLTQTALDCLSDNDLATAREAA